MIIDGKRSLAHVEKVELVKPVEGANDIELIGILGWTCIAKKGEFKKNDLCVYIEIDSEVPKKEWSEFLREKQFKIKTLELEKFNIISQGIALPLDVFEEEIPNEEGRDVTELLEITYSHPNYQHENNESSESMNELFEETETEWLMERNWGKQIVTNLFGNDSSANGGLPAKFKNIPGTRLECCENMPRVLEDKTPFIRTQKCDGLSATYILEKVSSGFFNTKYEFHVYSHNMRIPEHSEESSARNANYYWEMAEKYDIENKLKHYLKNNKDCDYVCWQGEICGPEIKNNPHKLMENHLFCFNMTDSDEVFDIRESKRYWDAYDMESVPIENMTYVLPDDFEEFKLTADGNYSPGVCESQSNCAREGWVYYKTTDPGFSFKNISRKYLLKREE